MAFAQLFETSPRFIERHFDPADRLCIALLYRGAGLKTEFMSAAQAASPRVQAHLRAANAHGAEIYYGVNSMKPDARSRTKADVDEVRHLFCDIDDRGEEVVRSIVNSDLPRPTDVVESSRGKFQVLWRVRDFTKEQAEDAVRSITQRFSADQSVWDVARILRMPGFKNHKRPEQNWFVKIVPGERSTHILTPQDFPSFPKLERTFNPQARAISTPGHSQSEKDWADVMRGLERGVSPSVLISDLEAASGRKPNPRSYAELTVNKAVRYFESKRTRGHTLS